MDLAHMAGLLGDCFARVGYEGSLAFGLFMAGLVGGLTHCTVMCGPFVLGQVGQLEKLREAALVPYHLGRMTTYIVMAVLLSSIINVAFLFLPVRSLIIAPILGTAGLIFMTSALPSLSLGRIFPFLARVQIGAPYSFIQRHVQRFSQTKSRLGRYMLGIMLGFMPCGMIIGAVMAASTASNAFEAGMAMAAFGVGTIPALLVVGFGAHKMNGAFPNFMLKARPVLMVGAGLWLFLMAGVILI